MGDNQNPWETTLHSGWWSCRDSIQPWMGRMHPQWSPQSHKQQVTGTLWVPAFLIPGNSLGSVLSLPGWKLPQLLPSRLSRQLPFPIAKWGCSWLQDHHHLSPLMSSPGMPAGSQPCFSSKLEAKISPGGAGREHGGKTSPCEPSCSLCIPHGGTRTIPIHPQLKPTPRLSTLLLNPCQPQPHWPFPGYQDGHPSKNPVAGSCCNGNDPSITNAYIQTPKCSISAHL